MDAAVWQAMCPPVQAKYAAEERPRPARAALLWTLRRLARHRLARRRSTLTLLPATARILAIQPDHLGGVLLSTPALRLLKQALPDCEITALVGPWGADVAAHCPAVDAVEVCRFPGFARDAAPTGRWGRPLRAVAPWRLLWETATRLAARDFHLALVCHTDFYWGSVLSALTAVPHRIGYATPDATPFLSLALPIRPAPIGAPARATPTTPHVAERGLALARAALALAGQSMPADFDGRMGYEPTADERAMADGLWQAHGLDAAPAVIAIHAAPGAPAKRWPPGRFAGLADHLASRYGARVVLTGGPTDEAEAATIAGAGAHPPLVLAGQTSFGTLAALLERCRFVVGTDNGALHLATARGAPTLRLFGPVDAAAWHGWTGTGSSHPPTLSIAASRACAPCHRLDLPPWEAVTPQAGVAYPCMGDISVDQVVDTADQLWALTSPVPGPGARPR